METQKIPTGIAIRILKAIWSYMFAWLKLPFTIKSIEEKIQPKALSKNARFCPNCDERMKIASVYGDGNWYKCPKCEAVQKYNTIHS